MSGYGPFGFSQTLAYFVEATSKKNSFKAGDKDKAKQRNGRAIDYIIYFILRFALAVDTSLLFELLGAFILTQFDYEGYDFNTHKKAEAIVFIGCIGGLIQGLALVIVDVILRGQYKINDSHNLRNVAAAIKDGAGNIGNDRRIGPDSDTIMAGCVLRTFLWPALGALGGVTGTFIWHLAKHPDLQSNQPQRAATGALVQLVGAIIVVSAPSILQFILVATLSLAEGWESEEG